MTGALRVLFDGYWWEDGPTANRTVQRELISAWARCFPADEVVVALRSADFGALLPAGARRVRTRLWPHGASNAVELGRLSRRMQADWVVAHNYAPLSSRSAVFIHDILFRDHPEWFSPAERLYFAGMLPTARRAELVATSTATEATRIARHRRHSGEVEDIGLAVPTALASAEPQRPDEVADVGEFALTVGRLNVRKNLETVIRGAASSGRITSGSPLLVVGSSEHSGIGTELSGQVAELTRRGIVRFLGRVDDAGLAWLYTHTSLSISLSRDEGFGLTPVEAAWFGAPVLVSDIPVHRETMGGYASFVSPDGSSDQIGAAIDEAWDRRAAPAAREDLAERYTWDAAVRRLRQAMTPTR